MKETLEQIKLSFRNAFTVDYILKNEDAQYVDAIEERVNDRNYSMIFPVCSMVILISIIFVISDVSGGFYQQYYPYSILNICAEITHLSTIILLIVRGLDKREKTYKIKNQYVMAYLFICSLGCSIYLLSDSMRGVVSTTPYFSVMILVAAPLLFERQFWIVYGIYTLPTIVYYCVTLHFDVFNLTILFAGYVLHLYLLAGYVRELLINIKYEESHAKLLELNRTDYLTKIGNRQLLYETLQKNSERWIAEGKEICLVMMDIDNFKCYNDTYSHLQGDKCLVSISQAVSKVLKEHTISEITFIRFGGEEFLIMMVGAGLEKELYEIYGGIRKEIAELSMKSGNGATYPYVTISAGAELAMFTDKLVIEELMLKADSQLYHVKESGRNGLGFCGRIFREMSGDGEEHSAEF